MAWWKVHESSNQGIGERKYEEIILVT